MSLLVYASHLACCCGMRVGSVLTSVLNAVAYAAVSPEVRGFFAIAPASRPQLRARQ